MWQVEGNPEVVLDHVAPHARGRPVQAEGLRVGLAVAAELPGAPAHEKLVARHVQRIEIDVMVVSLS